MRLILIALMCLVGTSASAEDPELVKLGDDYRSCVKIYATFYGQKSCHPPSELLPAIAAHCRPQRDAITSYLSKKTSNDVVQQTLELVDSQVREQTTATIVDGQIKRDCP